MYRLLGATRDDAAGEAFDKVAKLLGLPYPGGRPIENLAREGDPSRFRFTKPMVRRNDRPENEDYYQFSFSGLKTAILNAVRESDDIERDKILTAEESLAYGLVDQIVSTRKSSVSIG